MSASNFSGNILGKILARISTKIPARVAIGKNRQRGSVLVVAMIALVALATLGSLTVVTVRSSLSGTTHDQFKAVALSAAEAGVSVGIDFARKNLDPQILWSNLVHPNNVQPGPAPIPGNGVKPGQAGYLFSADSNAWYEVEILNNIDDGPPVTEFGVTRHRGFIDGNDTDGRIVIRSIGHGPNNASVRLEVEIQSPVVFGTPCNTDGNEGTFCE
jgi:hypothetical protein